MRESAMTTVSDPLSESRSFIRWRCLPFGEVPPRDLYGALALRSQVFVVEQRCIYQDPDGLDPDALLIVGTLAQADLQAESNADADAGVIATARVLGPGVRFEEPSIGRVCTSRLHRQRGLGRKLMGFSIASAKRHHPGLAIRISAQAYLQRFYESFGFVVVSQPYLEDEIPHLEMRLAPD
jgi:ElaA protein